MRKAACVMNSEGMTDAAWVNFPSPDTTISLAVGRRAILVIGAAAGRLTAVCKLLRNLPATFDAAIVIALEISSQPESSVLQILRGFLPLNVSFATEGVLVRRGPVLVSTERHPMRCTSAGTIELANENIYVGGKGPVDLLFETAAAAYGRRVIEVLLSGASHDGTAGHTLIEAAGGAGVVQDLHEAFDGSMSMSAIRSDHPHYCCALKDMVLVLIKLTANTQTFDRSLAGSET